MDLVLIAADRDKSSEELNLDDLVEKCVSSGFKVRFVSNPEDVRKIPREVPVEGVINFLDGGISSALLDRYPDLFMAERKRRDYWLVPLNNSEHPIVDVINAVYFWLGKNASIQRSSGFYSSRYDTLKKAVDESPSSPSAWFEFGKACVEKAQIRKAFDSFKTSLELDTQNADALCELIELSLKYPDLKTSFDSRSWLSRLFTSTPDDEIIKYIDSVLAKQPTTRPEPYVFLGELKLDDQNPKGAYYAYRDALVRCTAVSLENVLRSNEFSEDDLKKVVFAFQVFGSRVPRLFPRKWRIGDVVLKVYDNHEQKRVQIEGNYLTYAAKHKDLFVMPDGSRIAIPGESAVLHQPGEANKFIHRMKRLPGKLAFNDLSRLQGQDRYLLLKKLATSAAVIDNAFNEIYHKEEGFRSLFVDERSSFVTTRFQKFTRALEDLVGFEIPDADWEVFNKTTQFAENRLKRDTPDWLLNVRVDHCPHNYLLDFDGNKFAVPAAEFVEKCSIGRFDFEDKQRCYGIWDLVDLVEYPGCEVDDAGTFNLVMHYVITRLNLKFGGKNSYDDLMASGGEDAVNSYIENYDLALCHNAGDRGDVSPMTTLRFQYLGWRFLRHLELVGKDLMQERSCIQLMEEIDRRKNNYSGKGDSIEKFYETSGADDEYEQLQALSAKLLKYKSTIYSNRSFHVAIAKSALEQLARVRTPFKEIVGLDAMMTEKRGGVKRTEKKDYFDIALSEVGSYRANTNGPSIS